MGVAAKNFAKLGYMFFQLFWIIVGITIFFLARHLVRILPDWLQCPSESGDGTACLGPSAIIRMSFVLAGFHLTVFIITLTRGTFAAVFHDGCWMFKFLSVFLAFCGALYIPNSFFEGYM
jgi:Serine incorporator (Serinc)